MDFKEERERKVAEIEEVLARFLPERRCLQKTVLEAMEYSLMAGGKRLRPLFMLETYRMFGGRGEVVWPFAAALEMIHTYSLVHDDLPAMDDDEYRRKRKTTHVVYGEAMGILAGDALLNYAFETAASAFDMEEEDARVVGRAMQVLAAKAGVFGMIGGQVVDVELSGKAMDEETLDFIYRLKTGALIECAMMVGAVLAGASAEQVSVVESIAAKVGMAFQIQDDILDVTGTPEVLGKPTHSDEKNEKTTYVAYKGLDVARGEVARLSGEAVEMLRDLHPVDTFLEELLLSLIKREK